MSETGFTSVTENGITVTSTSESAEQISEAIAKPAETTDESDTPRDKVSEAASELGKRSAEARKAKADAEQPGITSDEPVSPGKDDKPLGKPRDDPRARMLEATRKEAEAKRERDSARAEAAAARKELEALRAPRPAERAVEATPGKPVQADFATYDDWVEAVTDWKAAKAVESYEAKVTERARVEQYSNALESAMSEAVDYRKEYSKQDATWEERISPEVKAVIPKLSIMRDMHDPLESDNVIADELLNLRDAGPRLMLHLSEHPDEFQRIRALRNANEVQVEMRLLARSLNGAVTQATAPRGEVSRAKPPVRPVTGSSHTTDSIPGDDEPYDAHRSYWNAREQRAR